MKCRTRVADPWFSVFISIKNNAHPLIFLQTESDVKYIGQLGIIKDSKLLGGGGFHLLRVMVIQTFLYTGLSLT